MNQAVQAMAAYRRQFDAQGYSRVPQLIPLPALAAQAGASAELVNWPGGDILAFPDGSRLIPPASGEYVRGRAPRWQTDEPETEAVDERTADRRAQRR